MKDTAAPLRKGYYDKLQGISVGVFDELLPVNNTSKSYVLLTSQTADEARTKERFMSLCTMLVMVVVRSLSHTGRIECDAIADEVLQTINPLRASEGYIEMQGFQVLTTVLLQNESTHQMSGTEHIYRRLLRFQHKVIEN